MTDQQTITEWLCARLDEDEAAARAATPGPWHDDGGCVSSAHYQITDYGAYTRADGEPEEWEERQQRVDSAHIARHDPARALREVAAKRATIAAHPIDTEYDTPACRACQWDSDCGMPLHDLEPSDCPCPTLRNLAWPRHLEDGWDPAWCPHHEEDHTETEPRDKYRVFKRTCRHCRADLGDLLKPREEWKP